MKLEEGANLTRRMEFIEEVTGQWWSRWYQQVFPSLVPYSKWVVMKRPMLVGDIVLILYEHKYDKGEYKLGRVLEVHQGDDGVTRRVTVGYARPSKGMEIRPLAQLTMGIQRLVVVLPVEDQVDVQGKDDTKDSSEKNDDAVNLKSDEENNEVGEDGPNSGLSLDPRLRRARDRARKEWAQY